MLSQQSNIWPMSPPWYGTKYDMVRLIGIKTDQETGCSTVEPNHHVHVNDAKGRVEIELPGVSMEEIEIDVEKRVLKIEDKSYAVVAIDNKQEDGNEQFDGKKDAGSEEVEVGKKEEDREGDEKDEESEEGEGGKENKESERDEEEEG